MVRRIVAHGQCFRAYAELHSIAGLTHRRRPRHVETIFAKPHSECVRTALHDHGGMKYMGWRKIVRTDDHPWPVQAKHQEKDYAGTAWANEIAKRGYAVLVHDTFPFGSRRVRVGGREVAVTATGDGPVDAALKAIERATGVQVVLRKFEVRSVEDLMFVLMQAKPGETVTGVVLRDGKEVRLETTFQEGRRH